MQLVNNNLIPGTDRTLVISTGASRHSINWRSRRMSWKALLNRLSNNSRTAESSAEYKRMSKAAKNDTKDVGGFVGGTLKDGRRKTDNLISRSIISLDMDYIDITVEELWASIVMITDCELCIYSTHSHTPEAPRLRLIAPLNRDVNPEEYQAITQRLASDIGLRYFDATTFEPIRLMYWPSTPQDGEFVFKHQPGALLDADAVLSSYHNWSDIAEWPISDQETETIDRLARKQADPLTKSGLVGAFCRTYSIADVLETYLPDLYAPTEHPDRYTYTKGTTVGGLVIYENKYAYSHHGTDPISGKLCNAFDLVRLHLYSGLDEDAKENTPANRLPSYIKMTEVCQADEQVRFTLGKEALAEAETDFTDETQADTEWLKYLAFDRRGKVESTIDNTLLIMTEDPRLKDKFMYDSFANRATVIGEVPWSKQIGHDWSDKDDSGLRHYLEKCYGISGAAKIDDARNLTFDRCQRHPVREYLNDLIWDGVPRVATIFSRYLGAEDNLYTREVAKVHLTAAVARIMQPGIKYDTMVTLSGPQGIGKSTFIATLARDWFSDNLDTMRGKEGAELIQGVWHVELSELNATRKSDIEMVRAFLSRRHDIYRVAYAKHTSRFPRQCIFWGTTNDAEFLRDPTGERRTYPIDCHVQPPTKDIFTELPEEVDQIWAEAKTLYEDGQTLYLTGEPLRLAQENQEAHKEDQPLKGIIEEYLELPLPYNWNNMSMAERQDYISRGPGEEYAEISLIARDRVCVYEVWCELLCRKMADLRPLDSRNINNIISEIKGWERLRKKMWFGKLYSNQRGFKKSLGIKS